MKLYHYYIIGFTDFHSITFANIGELASESRETVVT